MWNLLLFDLKVFVMYKLTFSKTKHKQCEDKCKPIPREIIVECNNLEKFSWNFFAPR